jgi:hypothetical protein
MIGAKTNTKMISFFIVLVDWDNEVRVRVSTDFDWCIGIGTLVEWGGEEEWSHANKVSQTC